MKNIYLRSFTEGTITGFVNMIIMLTQRHYWHDMGQSSAGSLPLALGMLLGWRHGVRSWICFCSSSAAHALITITDLIAGFPFDKIDNEMTATVYTFTFIAIMGFGMIFGACARGFISLMRKLLR